MVQILRSLEDYTEIWNKSKLFFASLLRSLLFALMLPPGVLASSLPWTAQRGDVVNMH